jgi:mono/diheme cytochrome c family protein
MMLGLTSRHTLNLGMLSLGMLMLGALLLLDGGIASAQNLDRGKPGQKLFADSCVNCHRSPRGLAKGRFSLTLRYFLQQHYSSGPETAAALADYLQSVDAPPPGKPRGGAKHSPRASQRPPASVPQR